MTTNWWRGSSDMVGSSASTILACVASTRASATRARSPPDSVVTMRVANSFVPVTFERRRHRLPVVGRDR